MNTRQRYLSVTVTLVIVVCISAHSMAQITEAPFDLTEYQSRIDELGVPTMSSVKEIADRAQAAFANGQHEEAIPLLQEWAKKANWLANLISGGLQPYYKGSYDDRKSFPSKRLSTLSTYERASNDLKAQRNHAMVMEAECHMALGYANEAASLYMKALELLHIDDWDWWLRAANGLYFILGADPITDPLKKK